jgi:hypothetical protein
MEATRKFAVFLRHAAPSPFYFAQKAVHSINLSFFY